MPSFLFLFGCLSTAAISAVLAATVYIKGRKRRVNQLLSLSILCTALWILGLGLMTVAPSERLAIFYLKYIHYFGAIFIPVIFLHFVFVLLGLERDRKKLLYFLYIIAVFLQFANFTDLLATAAPRLKFYYYTVPLYLYPVFTALFFMCTAYAEYLLYVNMKTAPHYKKNQLKYLFIGTGIGFIGGSTAFAPVFNLPLFPFGIYFVPFYVIILSYAILRHRLMDIRLTITRTGVFIIVYTLILGIPFAMATWCRSILKELLGPQWWIAPLVSMAGLATVGPFVYIALQRRAEIILLREQKRYQDTLKQAAVGMTRVREIKKLLSLIVHIVTKAVRISHSAIYLYNEREEVFLLEATRNIRNTKASFIAYKRSLITWLKTNKDSLVYEELKQAILANPDNPNLKEIAQDMQFLNASLIVPCFLENTLQGFLVLGNKRSGHIYTTEDLNVFSVLASQAALAIENAQFIQNAKELHEQIAQAEKMVTIGTMADGLAHQINNRFSALALLAGDSLDSLSTTDLSGCTQELKEMIRELKHSLERIQANVIQGGEVVRGLLKYSRPGDTGMEPLDLHTILVKTIEMVQFKVKLTEIDIVHDYPADLPKIKGSLAQLEEAFFNFIDNAYDATVERRELLREEGFRGKITISSGIKRGNDLEIIVADNGIGVKLENNEKLFTPFFTTKSSSHSGTGLGLYVIRKIIMDNHKGSLRFESKHKVGTRFIIELPIAEAPR